MDEKGEKKGGKWKGRKEVIEWDLIGKGWKEEKE